MKKVLSIVVLSVLLGLLPLMASAKTIEVHCAYGKGTPFLWESLSRVGEQLKTMSEGSIDLKLFASGELVQTKDIFESVSNSSIDAGWGFIVYWAGSEPVNNMGALPFGANPRLMAGWIFEGGGQQLIQKGYDKHGVVFIPAHITEPEPGGWFQKEINTVDDIKGLKMRISGLGGKVLNKLGASAQILPAGDLYLALERGRIDATEFSLPVIDKIFGFNKIAKYYYYPGWHQPASLDGLIINKKVWDKFTPHEQALIRLVCRDNAFWAVNTAAAKQMGHIEEFEKTGVQVKRFPEPVLNALRNASEEVVKAEAASDPLFKEAYESLTNYIKKVGRWDSLQTLPRN
ncbi:MAG: TRAP transporter substrate-binding protein [Desulfobacterales bacterium]|nr:TRAP transporter substrate-binding protein [Desulfobacterales bacterium]